MSPSKPLVLVSIGALACVIWGCTKSRLDVFVPLRQQDQGSGGFAGTAAAPSMGGDLDTTSPCDPCFDFPSTPIFDTENGSQLPSNVGELFGPRDAPGQGVGPCLVEPELGSLFPQNWLRPRFRFVPATGQSVFEIRLRADSERNDLVVYTAATSWTLPAAIWKAITETLVGQPITISVRGLDPTQSKPQPSRATTGAVTIAPAQAAGGIVYWTTTGSAIKGFSIGEESSSQVLGTGQTRGRCVGCHTTTPDGRFVAASVSSDDTQGYPAHIELRSGDGSAEPPDFLTTDAQALLDREQQHLPAFSPAHWQDGDHLLLTLFNGAITWTDLEATSQREGSAWGGINRTGDPNGSATHAVLNHGGTAIAYTSVGTSYTVVIADHTDIYVLPFNQRQGGTAAPLVGASSPDANEFYPDFTSDDALVGFTKTPPPHGDLPPAFAFAPSASIYGHQESELFVVQAKGGVAQRLRANDPPTCSGTSSPGVTNRWGKWSPQVEHIAGKTYYWLAFASNRSESAVPQIYLTPVVVDDSGQISSYPALYFWNQPASEHNHTPAWNIGVAPKGASR